MQKRVALIVDNPYRDLPGLTLLALRLCQEGVVCHLVPLNLAQGEIWALRPDLVLSNYLRVNNEGFVSQMIKAGMQVGVLDTEGGVFAYDDEYAQTMSRNASVRYAVDFVCFWGPRLASRAVEAGWYHSEQVSITGAPRYDFYADIWRPATERLLPQVSVPAGQKMVLVLGSYPLGNPGFQTPRQEIEMMVDQFGYERSYVEAWAERQLEALRGLVALTNHLARKFPEVQFVLRPHPFERLDTYKALLDPFDNLQLERQGTADSWIFRSELTISYGSSTAIDAALFGKPTLAPVWLPAAAQAPAADHVVVPCESEEVLTRRVQDVLEGRFQFSDELQQRLGQVIGDWFYRIDGLAHQRVASEILKWLASNRRSTRYRAWVVGMLGLYLPLSRLQKVRHATYRLLSTAAHVVLGKHNFLSRHRWAATEKFFDSASVRKISDAIVSTSQALRECHFKPVVVQLARLRDDYRIPYKGYSVTIAPDDFLEAK